MFSVWNFSISKSSRTKAFTTRLPAMFSATTALRFDSCFLAFLKAGWIFLPILLAATAVKGETTRRIRVYFQLMDMNTTMATISISTNSTLRGITKLRLRLMTSTSPEHLLMMSPALFSR